MESFSQDISTFDHGDRAKHILNALKSGMLDADLFGSPKPMKPVTIVKKVKVVPLKVEGQAKEVTADSEDKKSPKTAVNNVFEKPESREPTSDGDNSAKKRRRSSVIKLNIPEDGYMWHKYGQKNIVDTQKRRNYYRCSMSKECACPAKRTIDFHLDDLNDLQIVHQEKHNHDPRPVMSSDPSALSSFPNLEDLIHITGYNHRKSPILKEWELRANSSNLGSLNLGNLNNLSMSKFSASSLGQAASASNLMFENEIGGRSLSMSNTGYIGNDAIEDGNNKLFKWLSMESIDSERVKNYNPRNGDLQSHEDKDLSMLLQCFSERTGMKTGDMAASLRNAMAEQQAYSGSFTTDYLSPGVSFSNKTMEQNYDYFPQERPRKSNLMANQLQRTSSLAPLPANRPPSDQIRTPVGNFAVNNYMR